MEGFGGLGRRLRLGMVGGGAGSFIGSSHRMAARLDDRYELVAGALSSNAERAKSSAADLGIAPERAYTDYAEMVRAEAAREDGIEVVAIITPNDLHYGPAVAFLDTGVHVICDKPLTHTMEDAIDLVGRVRRSGLVFALTHAYAGYALVRHARELACGGELGEVRLVQVEYPQQSWVDLTEEAASPRDAWRRDPARSGAGGCIADIGTHAQHLASFVTGLRLSEVCADISTFVPGGQLDDNNNILLRFDNGARGMLWASKLATGYANPLRLRVFGTKAGIEWNQEVPGELAFMPHRQPPRKILAGNADLSAAAQRVTRLKPGHPEGVIEAFANIYTEVADVISARILGREPDPLAFSFATVEDGALGMKFVEAALESSAKGSVWTDATLDL
ncbi:MAG: Gfo/Idh/MocA family oxidoreductase [Rhodospirillales bacterium]|nr:Gfo/Idh/MocA family oxidoreductase [Rhodospirillales bacterium]